MTKNLFGFWKWIGPECRKSSKNSKKLEQFFLLSQLPFALGRAGGGNVARLRDMVARKNFTRHCFSSCVRQLEDCVVRVAKLARKCFILT